MSWDETLKPVHGNYGPDLQAFVDGWKAGSIIIVIAKGDTGIIDGYQLWMIGSHAMIPNKKSGTLISVFLTKENRAKNHFPVFLNFGMMAATAHGSIKNTVIVDAKSSMRKYLARHKWTERSIVMELNNV